MTISDFLLVAVFAVGALYVIYRLFLGWLYTRWAQRPIEEPDERSRCSDERQV